MKWVKGARLCPMNIKGHDAHSSLSFSRQAPRAEQDTILQLALSGYILPFSLYSFLSLFSNTSRNSEAKMSLPEGVVAFGPDATCTLDTCPIEWSVYGYRPSLAANGAFIGLFALGGLIHAFLGIRWRTWWFMSCMVICAVNGCIGYAGRVWLYFEPFNFNAFMMQMSKSSIQVSAPDPYFNPRISLHHHRPCVLLCSHLRNSRPDVSRFHGWIVTLT